MLVYLAAPYNHPDPAVTQARMEAFYIAAANLTNEGYHVVSPLLFHPIASRGLVGGDWKFWKEHAGALLTVCERLYVLTLEGWLDSEGVTSEIELARQLGLPITYLGD